MKSINFHRHAHIAHIRYITTYNIITNNRTTIKKTKKVKIKKKNKMIVV